MPKKVQTPRTKSRTKTGSILENEKWSKYSADKVTLLEAGNPAQKWSKIDNLNEWMNEKWKRCIEDDRNGPKENERNMIDEKN